jgi:hypothetical protein
MLRRDSLVTIATFSTITEAFLAKGALETAGIPALVPGEGLGTFSLNRGAISMNELQVFEADRDRAVAELRRLQIRVVERRSE